MSPVIVRIEGAALCSSSLYLVGVDFLTGVAERALLTAAGGDAVLVGAALAGRAPGAGDAALVACTHVHTL